jgi:carboxymethylenebutenolidase
MLRHTRLLPLLFLVACHSSPRDSASAAGSPAPSASAPAVAEKAAPVDASATDHAHHDVAPELVHFAGTRGTLGGFLYKPKGEGPFPAILFNHGSEQYPGDKLGQALFYVTRGFVLFVPHRLGHGQSPGEYVMDAIHREPEEGRSAKLIEILQTQVEDVASAADYLKRLPYVDRSAVAMAGCSFGGIETLLASEQDLGLRAAIDFSGAAQTWSGNAPLRARMRSAAHNAKTPIFFLQASNDYDTQPSIELAKEMQAAGRPHLLKIFPPNGTTPEEGHAFCAGGMKPPWGEDVIAFLRKNGVVAREVGGAP